MNRPEAGELKIGVVGYGAMGKAHAYGYTAAPVIRPRGVRPRLTLLSGRNEQAVRDAAAALGFAAWTTDWHELVTSTEVDVVDICTPPGTHAEIIQAAAAAGKAVICEKPLAVAFDAGAAAVAAVAQAGVLAAIGFNYRYLPAVALMHDLIAAGEIGQVLLWRGSWLSDEGLVYLESEKRAGVPPLPAHWELLKSKFAGEVGYHLARVNRRIQPNE